MLEEGPLSGGQWKLRSWDRRHSPLDTCSESCPGEGGYFLVLGSFINAGCQTTFCKSGSSHIPPRGVPEAGSSTPSSALGAVRFSKCCQSSTWEMDLSLSANEVRQLFLCSLTFSHFSSFTYLFIDLFVAYSLTLPLREPGFSSLFWQSRRCSLSIRASHVLTYFLFSCCFWDFFPSASERLSPR